MYITVADIMKLRPCSDYSLGRVKKLWDGRDSITPGELAKLDIPGDDIIWALTGLMTEEQQRAFARRCALDVIHIWDAPDIVRRYLDTGDDSIRDAAWAAAQAARDAACAAAAWDASRAARDAAMDAARDAAWAAARAAASAVAWAASAVAWAASAAARAASDAAMDAAWAKYIGWAVEMLEGK